MRSITITFFVLSALVINIQGQIGSVDYHYGISKHTTSVSGSNYTLSIPTYKGVELDTIKGVLAFLVGGGGTYNSPGAEWHRWMYENGFAVCGCNSGLYPNSLVDALDFWAENLTSREELEFCPLMAGGNSMGGAFSYGVAMSYPSRTLGVVPSHHASGDREAGYSFNSENLKVPAFFIYAEHEYDGYSAFWRYYQKGRDLGTQWSAALDIGKHHTTPTYERATAMKYFEECIKLGYPDHELPFTGPIELNRQSIVDGWCGELIHSPLKNNLGSSRNDINMGFPNFFKDFDTYYPFIAPYNDFPGEPKTQHCWFPNRTIATLWQSFVSQGHKSVRLKSPDLSGRWYNSFNVGQTISAIVDITGFYETEKVSFYMDTILLYTDDSAPFEYEYSLNKKGTWMLYAVAESSCGEKRISSCWADKSYVMVFDNTKNGNQAPTCSKIDTDTIFAGSSVSFDFTIADNETAAGSLTVYFSKLSGNFSANVTGSGASRTLEITVPSDEYGEIGGVLMVTDGDLTVNEYVTVYSKPLTNVTPEFGGEYVPNKELISPLVWSKPNTFRVYDYNPEDDLIVTAWSNDQNVLNDSNIIIEGTGEFRTVRYKLNLVAPNWGESNLLNIMVSDGQSQSTISDIDVNPNNRIDNLPPFVYAEERYYGNADNTCGPFKYRVLDFHDLPEEIKIKDIAVDREMIDSSSVETDYCGSYRTISFDPQPGMAGITTVMLSFEDSRGLSETAELVVEIIAEETSSTDILNFQFKGIPTLSSSLNFNEHTVNIEVLSSVDISNLVAEFELSAGANATVDQTNQISGKTVNDFSSPVAYTIKNGSETEVWEIIVWHKSTEADFVSFNVRDVFGTEFIGSAFIDLNSHAVYLDLPEDHGMLAMVPVFELSDGASAWIDDELQISDETYMEPDFPINYKVVAEDGVASESWTILLGDLISSGSNLSEKKQVLIYPNPARERLYISTRGLANISNFRIINLQGKVILESNFSDSIDVTSIESGIYLVEMTDELKNKYLTKLIID